MKFCGNCGTKVNEEDAFCLNCGNKLFQGVQNSFFTISQTENKKKSFSPNKNIIKKLVLILTLGLCVFGVIFSVNYFLELYSLENRLMKNEWWADTRFESSESSYRYSNSDEMIDGYSTYGVAEMFVFCEYGTIRIDKYISERCLSENRLTADTCPSYLDWRCSSDNDSLWRILDDNTLVVNDDRYEWKNDGDEDTWYMSNGKLRIGENVYTLNRPSYVKNTYKVPPYWCEKCGQEGPFKRECPECEYDVRNDE